MNPRHPNLFALRSLLYYCHSLASAARDRYVLAKATRRAAAATRNTWRVTTWNRRQLAELKATPHDHLFSAASPAA